MRAHASARFPRVIILHNKQVRVMQKKNYSHCSRTFSASLAVSLALATVVFIWPCSSSDETRFLETDVGRSSQTTASPYLSIISRCEDVLDNFLNARPCFMADWAQSANALRKQALRTFCFTHDNVCSSFIVLSVVSRSANPSGVALCSACCAPGCIFPPPHATSTQIRCVVWID
jgi:hypothetical protein